MMGPQLVLTFQHFHSHCGVSSFALQSEGCCFHHLPKLSFPKRLTQHQILTWELPFWILLLADHKRNKRN